MNGIFRVADDGFHSKAIRDGGLAAEDIVGNALPVNGVGKGQTHVLILENRAVATLEPKVLHGTGVDVDHFNGILAAFVQPQVIRRDAAGGDVGLHVSVEVSGNGRGSLQDKSQVNVVIVGVEVSPVVFVLGHMDVLAVNPLVKDPGAGAHKVLVVESAFTLGFPLRFLNDRRDGEAIHNRGIGLRQLDGHGVVVGGLDSGQKRPVDGSNVQVGIVNQTLERANDIGRGKVRTVMPFDILPQGKCDFRAVLRKRPAFRQAGV